MHQLFSSSKCEIFMGQTLTLLWENDAVEKKPKRQKKKITLDTEKMLEFGVKIVDHTQIHT